MAVLKYRKSDGTYSPITNYNVQQNVVATEDVLGLVKVGYTQSGKNYPVNVDNTGNAYVNVPWVSSEVTETEAGLMSAEDKEKLDAITWATID